MILQQIVSGFATGCIYALVALGFVLIYKTTDVLNFAQGELVMLGAFVAYTFIAVFQLNLNTLGANSFRCSHYRHGVLFHPLHLPYQSFT